MNSAQDPDHGTTALEFCAEAERLWDLQRGTDSILSVAALQFLSLGYLGQGRDHSVLAYLSEASSMAERMGLYGVDDEHAQQHLATLSTEAAEAQIHATWGSFNWVT
jgi:hypothetical protein